jgi:hypothetical protein
MLQVWLTAPTIKRVLDRYGLRKPKIWVLTGLYELDGARVYEMQKTKQGASGSVDSVAVAALTSVPLGGGFDLGSGYSMQELGIGLAGRHVWAAQYRCLDIRYIAAQPGATVGPLPATFSLLPDVLSQGVLRANNSEVKLAAIQGLELGEPAGGQTHEQAEADGDHSSSDSDYDNELDGVMSELSRYFRATGEEDAGEQGDEPDPDEE